MKDVPADQTGLLDGVRPVLEAAGRNIAASPTGPGGDVADCPHAGRASTVAVAGDAIRMVDPAAGEQFYIGLRSHRQQNHARLHHSPVIDADRDHVVRASDQLGR